MLKKVKNFGVSLKASAVGIINATHTSKTGNLILYCRSLYYNEEHLNSSSFRVLLTNNKTKTFKKGEVISAFGGLITAIDNWQGNNFIVKTIYVDCNSKYSNIQLVEPSAEMVEMINQFNG